MALLTLENIHLHFGGVIALAGVNLEVNATDFFAIIGPNGAGKTSLFNCISGIYTPTRGVLGAWRPVSVGGRHTMRAAAGARAAPYAAALGPASD
jgi:ABC-type branched-subunit amino acid transport system ATPase component